MKTRNAAMQQQIKGLSVILANRRLGDCNQEKNLDIGTRFGLQQHSQR